MFLRNNEQSENSEVFSYFIFIERWFSKLNKNNLQIFHRQKEGFFGVNNVSSS